MLRLAGFEDEEDDEILMANEIAIGSMIPQEISEFDECLEVIDESLMLKEASPLLDGTDPLNVPTLHELVFAKGRVFDWDGRRERVKKIMSYDEAVHPVIFFLTEKIIQIIRVNRWSRVKKLSNLLDEIADLYN